MEFFGPLALANQHPPTVLFLSPVPDVASVLAPGGSTYKLTLVHTNHIIRELDSGVIADYDFEETRLAFEYRRGLKAGEIYARVPLAYRGHGILDELIAGWHNIFGLPNGLRNKFPDYQYRYIIATRQGPVYNDDGDNYGVGDLVLGYKLPVFNYNDGEHALGFRAGVKFPTGDPDKALGSGNFDYQLGVLYQRQVTPHVRGYANVDWVMVGKPDWVNVGYQDAIVYALAAEYSVNADTTLVSQYRIHRNPLRVGSKEADKDAQEIAVGFHKRVNDDLVWSGGFSEDINPETAPDLVITTNLLWDL